MKNLKRKLLLAGLICCFTPLLKAQDKSGKKLADLVQQDQAFLKKNKTAPGITETASGLQYKVVKMGTGKKPLKLDRVAMNYTLKLLDGKIVGSNGNTVWDHHMDKALDGMAEALKLMPAGSKWILYMPAKLCTSSFQPNYSGGRALMCTIDFLSIPK